QVRKALEAEQPSLLGTQLEDLLDQRRIRPLARGRPALRRHRDLPTQVRVRGVRQERYHARPLQREAVAALTARLGVLPSALLRGGGQPGEPRLILDAKLEGSGGRDHVLPETRRQIGQLATDRLETLLVRRFE